SIFRQSGRNRLPALSPVVGPVNIRMKIVDPETAYGNVGGHVIEMRCRDLCALAPRDQVFWSDVLPALSAIARRPDEPILRSGPDRVERFERRSQRISRAPFFCRVGMFCGKRSQAGGNSRRLPAEIGADGLPI